MGETDRNKKGRASWHFTLLLLTKKAQLPHQLVRYCRIVGGTGTVTRCFVPTTTHRRRSESGMMVEDVKNHLSMRCTISARKESCLYDVYSYIVVR